MDIDCSFDIIIIGEHIAIEHDSVDSQTKGLASQKCLAYLRSGSGRPDCHRHMHSQ